MDLLQKMCHWYYCYFPAQCASWTLLLAIIERPATTPARGLTKACILYYNHNKTKTKLRRMGRLLFSTVSANFFLMYIIFDMSDTNKNKYIYLHCLYSSADTPLPRYFVIAHQSLVIKVLKHTMHSSKPSQNSNTETGNMATRSADVRT